MSQAHMPVEIEQSRISRNRAATGNQGWFIWDADKIRSLRGWR